MFVPIPGVYAEVLKHSVMGFGDGPFGRQSGRVRWGQKGGAQMMELGLLQVDTRNVRTGEDAQRNQLSTSQEETPYQKPNPAAP